MIDTSKIERIAPDCWRNSQLSIARHYNGININGVHYTLDPETDYLVRADVWKKEMKDKKKRARVAEAEKERWQDIAQLGMF